MVLAQLEVSLPPPHSSQIKCSAPHCDVLLIIMLEWPLHSIPIFLPMMICGCINIANDDLGDNIQHRRNRRNGLHSSACRDVWCPCGKLSTWKAWSDGPWLRRCTQSSPETGVLLYFRYLPLALCSFLSTQLSNYPSIILNPHLSTTPFLWSTCMKYLASENRIKSLNRFDWNSVSTPWM